ncbi:hypothetical protein EPN28_01770 [Patescibacteria group bacterium]|nr:MAG: hypothetical protein EPN28_01770 [Patescibacteria group bacterium]
MIGKRFTPEGMRRIRLKDAAWHEPEEQGHKEEKPETAIDRQMRVEGQERLRRAQQEMQEQSGEKVA